MNKPYKIKITKKLLRQLKPYWQTLGKYESNFFGMVWSLEKKMARETGIKGIEFFQVDGEYVGIGNLPRTMRLIHSKELISTSVKK